MGAVLRAIDVFDIDIVGEPIEKWHAHPTREENRVSSMCIACNAGTNDRGFFSSSR